MASVDLTLPHHRYSVMIEPGLLCRLGPLVREVAAHERAALFSDGHVAGPYGPTAETSLAEAGFQVATTVLPPGEEHKTLDTVRAQYGRFVTAGLERRSPVVALGGGVTGDTVGFVAATYLRGVPFIQCPTTLLAMVDASVGGKVGVNLPEGKNLVGAFHQPALVAIDVDTLPSLPARELRCGLAECVKHGVIRDAELFAWIEDHLDEILALDRPTLVELVRWNVQIKAAVVMEDEREAGVRAHLNFGHTFAHAIEATCGYGQYHHGEAVALGMVAASRLAADANRCDPSLVDRLERLLRRIGLPTQAGDLVPTEELVRAMLRDKKVAGGRLRLVLPDRLGAVSIVGDTPGPQVEAAWAAIRA